MGEILANLSTFPTAVFTALWCLFMGLMVISIFSGFTDFDIDTEVDSDASWVGGVFLPYFHLDKVPLTISFSIVWTACLCVSYFIQFGLLFFMGGSGEAAVEESTGIFALIDNIVGIVYFGICSVYVVAIFIGSLYIAAPICKLISPIFCRKHDAAFSPIGKECTISTPTVTETYGEARIVEEGIRHTFSVYPEDGQEFKINDTCIVVKKHEDKNKYLVIKA